MTKGWLTEADHGAVRASPRGQVFTQVALEPTKPQTSLTEAPGCERGGSSKSGQHTAPQVTMLQAERPAVVGQLATRLRSSKREDLPP